jgi:hypothetical protein
VTAIHVFRSEIPKKGGIRDPIPEHPGWPSGRMLIRQVTKSLFLRRRINIERFDIVRKRLATFFVALFLLAAPLTFGFPGIVLAQPTTTTASTVAMAPLDTPHGVCVELCMGPNE